MSRSVRSFIHSFICSFTHSFNSCVSGISDVLGDVHPPQTLRSISVSLEHGPVIAAHLQSLRSVCWWR